MPLGHDVADQQAPALRLLAGRRKDRPARRVDADGLVRQNIQPGRHRLLQIPRPPAAVARRHDHVARPLLQHGVEIIRPGVDLMLPRRRLVGAPVERLDPLQVQIQVRSLGREHVDHRGDLFVHAFLHQGGVKVAGVERHQANGVLHVGASIWRVLKDAAGWWLGGAMGLPYKLGGCAAISGLAALPGRV